ncbi:hypothetical protein L9F63_000226, partial [Diploptera punctata]
LTNICSTYGGSLLQKAPSGSRPSLEQLLDVAPPDGVDLISKLLVFNPHKRLTAVQALEHSYVRRMLSVDLMPPLRDDIQLSVDEYRNKLYELMSSGPKPHSRQNKLSRSIRNQKIGDLGQVQQIYQPNTWSRRTQGSYSKKGRHLSAEMLTVHSVPEQRTVSVPIGHLLPTQSDINLRGRIVAVPLAQSKRPHPLSQAVHPHQQQTIHLSRTTAESVHRANGDGPNQQHIEQPKLVANYFRTRSSIVPLPRGGNHKTKSAQHQQISQVKHQYRNNGVIPLSGHDTITTSTVHALRW